MQKRVGPLSSCSRDWLCPTSYWIWVMILSIHNIKEEKGREESMRTREAKVKAEHDPRYWELFQEPRVPPRPLTTPWWFKPLRGGHRQRFRDLHEVPNRTYNLTNADPQIIPAITGPSGYSWSSWSLHLLIRHYAAETINPSIIIIP